MAFSNLTKKIRFCLYHYLPLDYVVNEVRNGVRKVSFKQRKMGFEKNLFFGYFYYFWRKYWDLWVFYNLFKKNSDVSE